MQQNPSSEANTLVKKFLAFYGTQMFITTFTWAQYLLPILSQINPVNVSPFYFVKISILILSFSLCIGFQS